MKYWKLFKVKEEMRLLKLNKNDEVLDVGAGTGYYSKYFSRYCKKVTLIDKSKKMLKRANTRKNITKIKNDITKIDLEKNRFDVIILNDVLHHINSKNTLLRKLKYSLKDDGRILIYDFDYSNFIAKILCFFEKILFKDISYLTFDSFIKLIKKEKFKVDKVVKNGFYYMVLLKK